MCFVSYLKVYVHKLSYLKHLLILFWRIVQEQTRRWGSCCQLLVMSHSELGREPHHNHQGLSGFISAGRDGDIGPEQLDQRPSAHMNPNSPRGGWRVFLRAGWDTCNRRNYTVVC